MCETDWPHLLRKARVGAGYTQTQLAEVLGVYLRTVQRWEHGDSIPPPYLLAALKWHMLIDGD